MSRYLQAVLLAVSGLYVAHAEAVTTFPYRGITYIVRREGMPRPVAMHIVQVDLSASGVRFRLSPSGGTREAIRETTLQFLEKQRAQIAVNAHFFLPFPSEDADASLVGLAASDGKFYSTCELPEQSYAIVANAPAIHIDDRNRARIVGCDVESPRTLISGSAQIITSGKKTIPKYDAYHPDAALIEGGPKNYSNANSWYDVRTARTVLGLSRDQSVLTVFTVDAKGGSEGMSVGDVADLLLSDYGVWDALNLDGGGSTTLAMRDPKSGQARIVNVPSDRNAAGRPVASSLAIFAEEP